MVGEEKKWKFWLLIYYEHVLKVAFCCVIV